jgi:hypothetical protein
MDVYTHMHVYMYMYVYGNDYYMLVLLQLLLYIS